MLRIPKKHSGFTLVEVLVALAILGVIATFTVPKLLHMQAETQKKAFFKQTLTAISEALNDARLNNELTFANQSSVILNKLSVAKLCPTNAQTEGCWTQPHFDSASSMPGALLYQGAAINGFNIPVDNGGGQWAAYFFIDLNGASEPNLEGEDQLVMCYCFGSVTWNNGQGWGVIRPGEIKGCANHPASAQMTQDLLK